MVRPWKWRTDYRFPGVKEEAEGRGGAAKGNRKDPETFGILIVSMLMIQYCINVMIQLAAIFSDSFTRCYQWGKGVKIHWLSVCYFLQLQVNPKSFRNKMFNFFLFESPALCGFSQVIRPLYASVSFRAKKR